MRDHVAAAARYERSDADPVAGVKTRACSAIVLAVLVMGCGVRSQTGARGAAPSGSAHGVALSAAAYRTAGTRTCRQYRRDVSALAVPRTVVQLDRYVGSVRTLTLRRISELGALHPPAALGPGVRALDRYVAPVSAALNTLTAALRSGPRRALDDLRAAIARLSPPIDSRWRALGIPGCGA